jgi:predicted RNase H-like nuclease (RuvC/YqgF family)
MAGPRPSSRKPRVDPVQVALQRLAEAQEATQWELHELTQAQRRTETRLEQLAQAQQRTETRLEQLAQAQQRTETRLEQLAQAQQRTETRLEQLAQAQQRTETRLEELARDLQSLTRDVQSLARSLQHMNGRVGNIEGRLLEDRYRADPFSFFQTILTRMRAVPKHELDTLASDSVDRGEITNEDREDLLRADVIVHGRPKGTPTATYLLAEVSATIAPHDVARAIRRAALLSRLTGESALPAVAGAAIDPDAATVGQDIWRVFDGDAVAPGQPVPDSTIRKE